MTVELKEALKISIENGVTPHAREILLNGIYDEAFEVNNFSSFKQFSILIRDEANKIKGGLAAHITFGGLYVALLWVDREIRKQGWGKILMEQVEDVAIKENCRFITLTTMDWQALGFYQKLGYEIEFIRHGYEHNSHMYMLRKNLSY